MNTERWRQIENILFATLDCEHAKRAAVLERSCACDDDLRREVESLLAHHAPSETYIETPAFLFAAGMLTEDEVADDEWQSKNRQFGTYKIIRVKSYAKSGAAGWARFSLPNARTVNFSKMSRSKSSGTASQTLNSRVVFGRNAKSSLP